MNEGPLENENILSGPVESSEIFELEEVVFIYVLYKS